MKAGYKQIIENLSRRAYSESATAGIIALFCISLLLLVSAIVCGYLQRSNQSLLPIFVITLGGAVLGFGGALI
jgi:hypothetical protein